MRSAEPRPLETLSLLREAEPLCAWLRDAPWPPLALRETWRAWRSAQSRSPSDPAQQRLAQQLEALKLQACQAAGLQADRVHAGFGASVFADDSCFTLFNPVPQPRRGWLSLNLLLQGPPAPAVRVLDAEGTPLPLLWQASQAEVSWRHPRDAEPAAVLGERMSLLLACPLRGLEALALRLEACEPHATGAACLQTEPAVPACSPAPVLALTGQRAAAWREPFELPHPQLQTWRLWRPRAECLELEIGNPTAQALPALLPGWKRLDGGGAELAPGRRARFRCAISS